MYFGWSKGAFLISDGEENKAPLVLGKEEVRALLEAIQDKIEYPYSSWSPKKKKKAKKRR